MPEHTSSLDHTTTIDALEAVLATTVALATDTPADLPIATCPGWDAAALWRHLGMVHRWAAETVATRSDVAIDRRTMDMHLPGDDHWAPWLAEGADALLGTLRDTAADEPVWVWADDPRACWWARRQLHETVVHNADAALALGRGTDGAIDVPPAIAADGIDELLDNLPARLGWRGDEAPALPELTVHLHATDTDGDGARLGDSGEWMVTTSTDAVTYTHGHGKGDIAVRAPVGHLLLACYGRLPVDGTGAAGGAAIFGRPGDWDRFLEVVTLG